jgi:hypothetical protein
VGGAAYGIPRNLFTAIEPVGPATLVVVPIIRPAAMVAVGVALRASDTSSALTDEQIAESAKNNRSLVCMMFNFDNRFGGMPLTHFKDLHLKFPRLLSTVPGSKFYHKTWRRII